MLSRAWRIRQTGTTQLSAIQQISRFQTTTLRCMLATIRFVPLKDVMSIILRGRVGDDLAGRGFTLVFCDNSDPLETTPRPHGGDHSMMVPSHPKPRVLLILALLFATGSIEAAEPKLSLIHI